MWARFTCPKKKKDTTKNEVVQGYETLYWCLWLGYAFKQIQLAMFTAWEAGSCPCCCTVMHKYLFSCHSTITFN